MEAWRAGPAIASPRGHGRGRDWPGRSGAGGRDRGRPRGGSFCRWKSSRSRDRDGSGASARAGEIEKERPGRQGLRLLTRGQKTGTQRRDVETLGAGVGGEKGTWAGGGRRGRRKELKEKETGSVPRRSDYSNVLCLLIMYFISSARWRVGGGYDSAQIRCKFMEMET